MRKRIFVNTVLVAVLLCASTVMAQTASEFETLKKEKELLIKENELLKKEIELLKKQIETSSTPEKKDNAAKVTLHGVEYEFVSLKMDGNDGQLIIAATNKSGKPKPFRVTAPVKLTAADGKQHRSGVSSTGRPWELQPDLKVEIPMKMGNIPRDVTEYTSIIIEVLNEGGLSGARSNPLILKGSFKVER